ncbi:hypothetical protein JTB14_028030 [Gonioctena quinquepunctata]|nr:hypothetical protein JTB14_028030 [Gonioctena quinquepunctata]
MDLNVHFEQQSYVIIVRNSGTVLQTARPILFAHTVRVATNSSNRDEESPSNYGNCDGPHTDHNRGYQNFPTSEKKEGKKDGNEQARPRPRIPPRNRKLSNPQIQENAP